MEGRGWKFLFDLKAQSQNFGKLSLVGTIKGQLCVLRQMYCFWGYHILSLREINLRQFAGANSEATSVTHQITTIVCQVVAGWRQK